MVHDQPYFRSLVEPHVDGSQVRFVGLGRACRAGPPAGRCVALLHLIDFEEPFGLSVVEALAAGTPVIATPRGSMPELVHDGSHRVPRRDADEAVAAVGRISEIDRQRCRRDAEARFSARRMVDDYERLFARVIAAAG